jgi:hypothetical protein
MDKKKIQVRIAQGSISTGLSRFLSVASHTRFSWTGVIVYLSKKKKKKVTQVELSDILVCWTLEIRLDAMMKQVYITTAAIGTSRYRDSTACQNRIEVDSTFFSSRVYN